VGLTCHGVNCGPGSSVGIATKLRSGRSGIESRWGRDIPPVQTCPGAHPASCKMGTGSFPGGKVRPGRAADRPPPSKLRDGRSGIESRWRQDVPPIQTSPGVHPATCKMCTGSFPGVKCALGVLLTTHHLLVPRSWKNRAIPLPTLWVTPGL